MNNTNIFTDLPDTLIAEMAGEILQVRIRRPGKRNAINDETILGIDRLFSAIPDQAKCVVISGEGKHFSAGLDLSELKERDVVEGIYHSRMWHAALDKLQFGKVPVVAVLHGAVVGGGLELACAAHIRVAEPSAFYALPEGQRGIYVGGGASVRLPKLIGVARMQDMMLTGRIYNADDGYTVGLSQYLVEEGQGPGKAMELARKIASNSAMTNYALLHVLPRIHDSSHEQGLMLESLMAAISQGAPEAKERLKLFLDGKAKKVGEA